MKALFLTAMLAGAVGTAWGQEYYLDLHKEPLEVPNRTVAVERVLDGRRSEQIGVMRYGGRGGRPATIFFRENTAADLTAFLQARLPARPADYPVVLCLRQLQLGEVLAMGSQPLERRSDTDLAFDAYVHQPDGYHFVQRVAGHWGGTSYLSALYLPARLAQLLSYCVGQLTYADWAAAASQPALSLDQLPPDVPTPRPPSQAQAAILQEAPRRGIYYSFAQFVANRPDTTQAFRLDTIAEHWPSRFRTREFARWSWAWWHVARVRPLVGASRPAVPAGIWGFCDGQRLFIERRNKFYQLYRHHDYFTFVAEAPFEVLYQSFLSKKPEIRFSQNPLLSTPVPGGEPLPLALDLRTGDVGSFPGLRPQRSDTAYVYLYRPSQARNLLPMRVFVNGNKSIELYPGSYCRLTCLHEGPSLRLSLEGVGPPDGPAQLLVPDTAQPTYLEITPLTGPNRYWRWVSAAQGQATLRQLASRRADAH